MFSKGKTTNQFRWDLLCITIPTFRNLSIKYKVATLQNSQVFHQLKKSLFLILLISRRKPINKHPLFLKMFRSLQIVSWSKLHMVEEGSWIMELKQCTQTLFRKLSLSKKLGRWDNRINRTMDNIETDQVVESREITRIVFLKI